MTERSTARGGPGARHAADLGIVAILAAAFTVVGFAVAFFSRQEFDDEGFFIYSMRQFLGGHHVYSTMITSYGPAYHELTALPFAVTGSAVGHDSARAVTLILWMALITGLGFLAWRLTGSFAVVPMTMALGFVRLAELLTASLQPAGLILLLLGGLVAYAQPGRRQMRPAAQGVVAGAVIALVSLTKLNMGLYALVAVGIAWVSPSLPDDRRRWAPVAALLGTAVALTPLLAGRAGSAGSLYVMLILVLMLTVMAAHPAGDQAVARSQWAGLVVAGAATTVVVLAVAAVLGNPVVTVVQSLLATNFSDLSASAGFTPPDLTVPALLAPPAAIAIVYARRNASLRNAVRLVLIVLTVITTESAFWPGVLPRSYGFLCLFTAPAILLPSPLVNTAEQRRGRLLIAALTILEALQIYPIAGSQVFFALAPAVLCGAILFGDLTASYKPAFRPAAAKAALAAGILLTALIIAKPGRDAWTTYAAAPSLPYPDSRLVHLNSSEAAAIVTVTNAATGAPCHYLIVYPGMLSFYEWTGLPAPPGVRTADGTWWSVPSVGSPVIETLKGMTNGTVCLIRDRRLEEFWNSLNGTPATADITRFFDGWFIPVACRGNYELWLMAPQETGHQVVCTPSS